MSFAKMELLLIMKSALETRSTQPPTVMEALKKAQQVKSTIAMLSNAFSSDGCFSSEEDKARFVSLIQLLAKIFADQEDLRIRSLLPEFLQTVVGSIPLDTAVEVLPTLVSESLLYACQHLERVTVTREVLLSNQRQQTVDMDDTTGWENLELHIKALQGLLVGTLSHHEAKWDLFSETLLIEASVDTEPKQNLHTRNSPKSRVWELLFLHCSVHLNRHVRENFFTFVSQLVSHTRFKADLLLTVLTGDVSAQKKTLIECIWDQLAAGLEDDWSQIRLAATLALQKSLQSLSKLPAHPMSDGAFLTHGFKNITKISMKDQYAAILLPRICLNRFHAAKSVQTVSQDIWQTDFSSNQLGRRLLSQHIKATIEYYCHNLTHAKNHMVSEAACHALAEVCLRLEIELILPLTQLVQRALLDGLDDERWPVKDAACLESGRILARFPPQASQFASNADDLVQCQFLHHWERHLNDCIWSVRENAALAFGAALLSTSVTFRELTWTAAVEYVQSYLLRGIADAVASTASPVVSGMDSFLPRAMVEQALQRKYQQQQQQQQQNDQKSPTAASSSSSSTVPIDAMRAVGRVVPDHYGNDGKEPSVNPIDSANFRKGWGCCVDCVTLRAAHPWEISHGALYLLREVLRSLIPSKENYERSGRERNAWLHPVHLQVVDDSTSEIMSVWTASFGNRSKPLIASSLACGVLELLEESRQEQGTLFLVKNVDKLHPAVYEEIPDMVESLQLWKLLLCADTPSHLEESAQVELFWQRLLHYLARDVTLTDDSETDSKTGSSKPPAVSSKSNSNNTSSTFTVVKRSSTSNGSSSAGPGKRTAASRTPSALRRLAAERCLVQLHASCGAYLATNAVAVSDESGESRKDHADEQDPSPGSTASSVANPVFVRLLSMATPREQRSDEENERKEGEKRKRTPEEETVILREHLLRLLVSSAAK